MVSYFESEKSITLESGFVLDGFKIGYSTYGKMNSEKSNVIWACHGLTGNSQVFDWWPGLFGNDYLFNPNDYFIVCANVLGSCYGSTNALSINPATGEPFYHDFPDVSVRDMVSMHLELASFLGIESINVLIGGSGGGQQSMEWAILEPKRIKNLVLISCNAYHSPWGIAFSEAQRMALSLDSSSSERSPNAGKLGLEVARAIGVLSYRSYDTFFETQSEIDCEVVRDFKVSSYLKYQGIKFRKRFDMFSYLTLINAFDSHNVGRKRGGLEKALSLIEAKTLVVGIKTDLVFPIQEQKFLSSNIRNCEFHEIESLYGHDGFLIETNVIAKIVREFLF